MIESDTLFDQQPNPPFRELNFKDFQRNETLGIGIPVVVIVKDTERVNRQRRLVDMYSQQRSYYGRTNTRDLTTGFTYATDLTHALDVPDSGTWYKEFPEPRNVSFIGNDVIVTASDAIHIFNSESGEKIVLTDPYFGNLHTSSPNQEQTRFMVTSTGFDSLLEFDQASKVQTWRWTAWNNGYNTAANGSILTEDPQEANELRESGANVILVDNSLIRSGFGIPTAMRATHVNEAIYDYDEDKILATFYHKGTLVQIDKITGTSEVVMSGMKHPHAIQKYKGGYILTDTSNGAWFQLDRSFNIQIKVNFADFPGYPENLKGVEWIQYVAPLADGLFIAADSNRQAAWVFSPQEKQYNQIMTHEKWSVHAILALGNKEIDNLRKWK